MNGRSSKNQERAEGAGRFLEIGGSRVHVAEAGAGTPLLLVHGLGGPHPWRQVMEPLSHGFRVLAVDLPGFGRSDPPPRPCDPGTYAEFLFELTQVLGLPGVVLCGVSFGGEVAVRFADLHPERVERIILLCSTGLRRRGVVTGPWAGTLARAVIRGCVLRSPRLVDFVSRRSYYDVGHRPPDLCRLFTESLRPPGKSEAFADALLHALRGDPEFPARLARLRAPALIVWGENDLLLPVEEGFQLKKLIPGSTLALFSECGHSIPLEKPAELVEAITKFAEQ